MVQTTPLFNALRQESYQAAKPRLLYRAQYHELANTLITTAQLTPESASTDTTPPPVTTSAATTNPITLLVTDKSPTDTPFAERHGHTFQLTNGTGQVILDAREMLTLYYSPALCYGMLGLAADQAEDPWLERVVTVQLDNPLDVVRALVKLPSLLANSDARLAGDLRFALLESLLAAPPTINSVPERSSYVHLVNQLGGFQHNFERLESLCVGVADRLHTNVAASPDRSNLKSDLKTCLRYLADISDGTQSDLPALNVTFGAGANAVCLASIVALVSDYVQQPTPGEQALLALRECVPKRYPLQAFQALSQYERDIITDADQATLSGIVEGEDLFSVLQMAQSLSRNGTLLLEGLGTDQKRGWIALKSGQATGIETFGATGIEALLEIILWGTSQFSFFDATTVTAQPLNKSTNELLMSIAQYLDFISQLTEQGFSPKAIITPTQVGEPDSFAAMFHALEHHPSLDDLIIAGYSRSEVLPALAALSEAGWLVFNAPDPQGES
jgi:hypothetical protein